MSIYFIHKLKTINKLFSSEFLLCGQHLRRRISISAEHWEEDTWRVTTTSQSLPVLHVEELFPEV